MLFNNIYVINLKRRPERWFHTCHELFSNGFKEKNITRFEAIDGQALFQKNPEYFKSVLSETAFQEIHEKKRKYHEQLTIGAVGCALSHISVWKDILKRNISSAVIFEDDIILQKDFRIHCLKMWKLVPTDWNFVFLGCWHRKRPIYINEHIVKPIKIFRLHAYIMNKGSAEILLNNAFPIEVQIDAYINQMFNLLNVYAFNPKLVKQKWLKWLDTDVQIPMKKFYDLRPILFRLRSKKLGAKKD